MKRIRITILLSMSWSLLFSVETVAQSSRWEVLTVKECEFSVFMPKGGHSVADTTQIGPGMQGVKISYTAGMYAATCMIYPEQLVALTGGEGLMDSWLHLFANTMKVKLEETSILALGQHSGRAFRAVDTINEEEPLYYIDGRIFSVGNKLIMLTATYQSKDEGQEDLERFLVSLELN